MLAVKSRKVPPNTTYLFSIILYEHNKGTILA